MSLQFSLFSYLIIGGFYVVSALGLVLLWWLNRSWKPIKQVVSGLALVLLVLPWADEVWIAWNFQRACEGAGIHVARQVEAEGFLNANQSSVHSSSLKEGPRREELADFEKMGFRYYETRLADKKIKHLERKDGWLHLSILDKPEARYHYVRTHTHSSIGYNLTQFENVIRDGETNEILGRDTRFSRYPSLIDRLWVGFYGSSQVTCRDPLNSPAKKRIGQIDAYVIKAARKGDAK